MNITIKAKNFAEEYFANITEKNLEGTPYIFHLERVADLVKRSGGNEIEIAAAWLHDIVEDTPVTIEMIIKEFGIEVGNIVDGLTDSFDYMDLDVQDKKQLQADKLLSKSVSVKRVKLADQISAVEIDSVNPLLSKQHRLAYCEGAAKIAQICTGISSYLDQEFKAALNNALTYLSKLQTVS